MVGLEILALVPDKDKIGRIQRSDWSIRDSDSECYRNTSWKSKDINDHHGLTSSQVGDKRIIFQGLGCNDK